ncbi:acyltransferase family protein [Streptomyces sp. BI20]|uniref:acyltransferase family protein n=1 Tax=Streptomyces sp. BI20 TaxID=3403460 RepID=UPI003C759A84
MAGAGVGARAGARRAHGRLRALDGLRLLAALLVACYHLGGRDGEVARAWGASPRDLFPTASTWFAYGPLGVQLFFLISGFVICLSAWGRTPRAFLASRAARLYPAYWAALALVTAAVLLAPGPGQRPASPSDLLLNLTMLQQPLGAERILGVCWTLWVELRFYVLFALCVLLPGGGRRRTLAFCGLWTFAAVLADPADNAFLDQLLMPQYAPFFVGGIGLYLVHRDRGDRLAWGVVAMSWLLGQHHAVAGLWHAPNPKFFSDRDSVVIIAIVTLSFAAVAAVALRRPRTAPGPETPARARVGRALTVAGALTYPFYLIHEHLGWPLIRALHRDAHLPAPAVFALTLTITLALAWAVHHWVERPLTPHLRRTLAPPAKQGRPARP